jgi:hypothetical protein
MKWGTCWTTGSQWLPGLARPCWAAAREMQWLIPWALTRRSVHIVGIVGYWATLIGEHIFKLRVQSQVPQIMPVSQVLVKILPRRLGFQYLNLRHY